MSLIMLGFTLWAFQCGQLVKPFPPHLGISLAIATADQGIMHTGGSHTKAGQKAGRGDGKEHMKAHVGTDAIAPAFVSGSRQPTVSTPFDMANRNASSIQDLVEFVALVRSLFCQQAGHLFDERGAGVLLPHELVMVGQKRKGGLEMTLGKAVKRSLAGKACPLAKEGQRDDFTARELGGWSSTLRQL
jgi:hypothetical protein